MALSLDRVEKMRKLTGIWFPTAITIGVQALLIRGAKGLHMDLPSASWPHPATALEAGWMQSRYETIILAVESG